MVREESSREDRMARRRARRARMTHFVPDQSVPSPCISICQIDNATGLCIGCHRDIDEIREWIILTAAQKTEILERIVERKAAES